MRFLKSFLFSTAGACSVAFVAAQNVPRPTSTLAMSGYDVRGSGLPANSASTLLNFTVEGDTAGNNVFHVLTSDPGVIVSLILPSGAEITSSNAASQGFTYTALPDGTGIDVDSVFSLPGSQTLIQIPGGQASGTYSIKANATSVNAVSEIIASYYASSNVRTGVTTSSSNYKVGDSVVLSGMVFEAGSPITGATVTAAVSAPLSLAGQATIGNPQLVSQQTMGPNLTQYQYSFTLTNTGSAVREVQAALASAPQNVSVIDDTLLFGDIGASSTTTSLTSLLLQADPASNFNPTTLQWNVSATGAVTSVSLVDSGTFDAAPGDGIYIGTFTPSAPGTYTAVLSVAGTSLEGNSFSRSAISSFDVTAQQLAGLTGFSDTQQANGITTTANVNVVTPGTYRFSMQLQASNQATVSATATANLSAGSQQIAATFPNFGLFALGVSGPYERINALLVFQDPPGDKVADANADAGPTAAYTLASVAPPLYFTGQSSATGVITTGGSTFDVLRVMIGVQAATNQSCDWSAELTDLAGNQIDFESGGTAFPSGSSSLQIDFNGNLIARSVNGPYLVQTSVQCGTGQVIASTPFQTQSFTTSQFTNVPADFGVLLASQPPLAPPSRS
jgi:hypothetical protein